MNTELFEKGCRVNDKAFASAIKQIANNVEDGEIGVRDAMDLIEKASTQHMRTAAVLVDTMKEDK